jgi:nitrogen fixation protein FixH
MNILAKGKFTGWHMTTILVAFFGVVIAVNFFMARMAVGTFGGTVVDNRITTAGSPPPTGRTGSAGR